MRYAVVEDFCLIEFDDDLDLNACIQRYFERDEYLQKRWAKDLVDIEANGNTIDIPTYLRLFHGDLLAAHLVNEGLARRLRFDGWSTAD